MTNDLYKTVRVLMRKVPPTGGEGFMMGSPSNETGCDATREDWHNVTLTKAFCAGVYEITQSQWEQVMGDVRSWPCKWSNNDYKLTRPVEQVSYYDVRENVNNTDDAAVDWPATAATMATVRSAPSYRRRPGCAMQKVRADVSGVRKTRKA